jgi:hypothetical protein
MGETPQIPLALDYASPDLSRLKRARKVAGFSALLMFMSTIAAAVFSSFGPLIVALCLWGFAVVAMVVFVIACVTVRRAQSAEGETIPGESTAG